LLSAITEFPLPAGDGLLSGLTVGPDGNLWFPEHLDTAGALVIGRITPAGALTEFPLPTFHNRVPPRLLQKYALSRRATPGDCGQSACFIGFLGFVGTLRKRPSF
jgi:hypothetical protein